MLQHVILPAKCSMDGTTASCSGRGLIFLPSLGLQDNTVKRMNFRGNRMENVTSQQLRQWPALRYLDLRYQRTGRCVMVDANVTIKVIGHCSVRPTPCTRFTTNTSTVCIELSSYLENCVRPPNGYSQPSCVTLPIEHLFIYGKLLAQASHW